MTKFCGACGTQLNGTEAFCGKCGAPTGPQQQPAGTPTQFAAVPTSQIPAQPQSSPVLKIVLLLLVLLVIGGVLVLGGIYYAAHRAGQKIHELAKEASSPVPLSGALLGDPCSLLSKEEVSQATGVTVVRVQPHGSGCAYIAEGDPEQMLSRHLAMTKGMEGLAGTHDAPSGTMQDVEVLSFSVLGGAFQTALAQKIFDNMGPASQDASGIGDRAVVVGGGMMMVRKGDKTVQIIYTHCPCDTEAVKPLAQKLVAAL